MSTTSVSNHAPVDASKTAPDGSSTVAAPVLTNSAGPDPVSAPIASPLVNAPASPSASSVPPTAGVDDSKRANALAAAPTAPVSVPASAIMPASTPVGTADVSKPPATNVASLPPSTSVVPVDVSKIMPVEKPHLKDSHDIPDTHGTSIIIVSPLDHPLVTAPGALASPASIPIPPPMPSTVSVINAPPTPDHITLPPAFPPFLGGTDKPKTPLVEAPPTPVAGATDHVQHVENPFGTTSAHKQPERVDTLVDLSPHIVAPRSRRNSLSDADSGKVKPSGLTLPPRPGYSRAASSGDLRSGLASPIIPSGAVE
ncbi:hypothetical protein ANO11243_006510 [Dothideomycetidae sp. 11243]|nr:hypothetical protein ANO11243_006510 [fungal sp. No.11243]